MRARKGASREAELSETKRREIIQGCPGWFLTKKRENALKNNLRQKNRRNKVGEKKKERKRQRN